LFIPIELSRGHRTLDLSVDGTVSHFWMVSTEPDGVKAYEKYIADFRDTISGKKNVEKIPEFKDN